MVTASSQAGLKQEIVGRIVDDRALLDQLRAEVRPLKEDVHRIQPRSTTAISLMGADGGNNSIPFDPILVQLIRVVDSNNNEHCLEAITPSTSVTALSARQFDDRGAPRTQLGKVMEYLGVRDITALTHMIRRNDGDRPVSPSWVNVYRELVEWAILSVIIREYFFATDTILIFDGLLRSKVFAGDLFRRYLQGMQDGIRAHRSRRNRDVYLAGVAKHSKVLDRYRLAMALEGVMATDYPAYVEIPRELEEKAYVWSEYARGNDREDEGGEINKFVGGKMFFVKFGARPRDPIWPVDIFLPQRHNASVILGCMLADAMNGFPVPLYPRCLQRAHDNAALVDFDFDVLQDQVFEGIRQILGSDSHALDTFRLQGADPAQRRYG
jgi:hypothetical protein